MRQIVNRWFKAMAGKIGALPARHVTWGLVALFSVWVLLDVMVFRVTGGLANSSYDAMVRSRLVAAAPDPRIVIVDIDEASLARMGAEFGRWPWPRDTLATVLVYLEKQQPAAIVWDIVFSDADRLSPGGDAAFNEAARQSKHSHFSVVRLPKANDAASQITRAALPGLWVAGQPAPSDRPAEPATTVALIPPALPGVASSRLGFNNGYVDSDGLLRRYRLVEPLADGSRIQSIVMSVVHAIDLKAFDAILAANTGTNEPKNELIAWRRRADAYPHASFADVFAKAEGGPTRGTVPSFEGKVIIIGSTAPSLHDIHPTPLSSMQAGVDSLATALDNALNQRHLTELPRALQAALAIALCIALGAWVQFKSAASLAAALFALPMALLAVSYVSLNGLPVFLDLHLSAGLALVFLAVLRGWGGLRKNHWCTPPVLSGQALAIWPWARSQPWFDDPLDRLIDVLERHAPTCRIVVCDIPTPWPTSLRWPQLACCIAIVGPASAILAARDTLEPALTRLARRSSEPVTLDYRPNREQLAQEVMRSWVAMQNGVGAASK